MKGKHPQNDLGEIGSQNLRCGKQGTFSVILFVVKTDADAMLDPPAPSLSLIGAAARDGPDRQARGSGAGIVLGNSRKSRIDDITDARNGDGGLCHIGGHNNLL